MLEGIEVLNQWTETATSDWAIILELAGLGMTMIFLIYAFAYTVFYCLDKSNHANGFAAIIFWILVIVGIILLAVGCYNESTNVVTETNYYQVIVSDEVSMTEFYEKYEVVKQEGKIYTIKEKK